MLRSTRLFLLLLTEAHLLLCNNCTYVFERLRPKYMKQIWWGTLLYLKGNMQGCENANLTFILKILKIENVQKIPWSFCRRRKLPRTFSFPKATAFWGLMSPEAWVDGYWIFLIIVRSDHWPAWRSPCHRRSRSSQVTRPRWLRGGRRPEMPALIAGPTLCGNVRGWFIKT